MSYVSAVEAAVCSDSSVLFLLGDLAAAHGEVQGYESSRVLCRLGDRGRRWGRGRQGSDGFVGAGSVEALYR